MGIRDRLSLEASSEIDRNNPIYERNRTSQLHKFFQYKITLQSHLFQADTNLQASELQAISRVFQRVLGDHYHGNSNIQERGIEISNLPIGTAILCSLYVHSYFRINIFQSLYMIITIVTFKEVVSTAFSNLFT